MIHFIEEVNTESDLINIFIGCDGDERKQKERAVLLWDDRNIVKLQGYG